MSRSQSWIIFSAVVAFVLGLYAGAYLGSPGDRAVEDMGFGAYARSVFDQYGEDVRVSVTDCQSEEADRSARELGIRLNISCAVPVSENTRYTYWYSAMALGGTEFHGAEEIPAAYGGD